MTVQEIDPKLQFVSDSQDVAAVRENLGLVRELAAAEVDDLEGENETI